jgi:hypothetical protein
MAILRDWMASLDTGAFFRRGFFLYLAISGWLGAAIGAVLVLADLFTDQGAFAVLSDAFQDAPFLAIRSVVTVGLTAALSFAGLASLGYVFALRAKDLRDSAYQGLTVVACRLIKVAGEAYAILLLTVSVNLFLAGLLVGSGAGLPFGPVSDAVTSVVARGFHETILALFTTLFSTRVDSFASYLLVCVGGGLAVLVLGVVAAFLALVVHYWAAELVGIVHGYLIRKPLFGGEHK